MDSHVRDLIDRVDQPTRIYLCGYAAASQWLAGTIRERPIRKGEADPVMDEVFEEQRIASDTVFDGPGALPQVNKRYAFGVWRMLSWATGTSDRPPLRLPI